MQNFKNIRLNLKKNVRSIKFFIEIRYNINQGI